MRILVPYQAGRIRATNYPGFNFVSNILLFWYGLIINFGSLRKFSLDQDSSAAAAILSPSLDVLIFRGPNFLRPAIYGGSYGILLAH